MTKIHWTIDLNWAYFKDNYRINGLKRVQVGKKVQVGKLVLREFKSGTLQIASKHPPRERTPEDFSSLLKENPFPRHGELISVEKLDAYCEKCDNPFFKLSYKNGKVVFFCKYCYY